MMESQKSKVKRQKYGIRTKTFNFLLVLFPFSFFLLTLSGCGYTNKSLIAPDANTIFVQTFKNSIDITKEASTKQRYAAYKPFIEIKVTGAIINRILYDGNLNILGEPSADLLLQGEVINYLRQPVRYADSKDILEYRLNIIVNFTLKDLRTDKILLEEKNFTADTSYFVSGQLAKSEDKAVEGLLEDLARRVANRIVNRW